MSETLVEKDQIQGVTVYRFFKNTREAVDQYLDLIVSDAQTHMNSDNNDKPLIYVLDVSHSGMYSLQYMRARASSILKEKSDFPKSYIAYVTDNLNDRIIIDMVEAIARQDVKNTRKVFEVGEIDQAIDWLISIREKETKDNF